MRERPVDTPQVESLPPFEFRLRKIDQRMPTPVDDFGRVDKLQLITDVRATLSDTYEVPFDLNDHHIYWSKNRFISVPIIRGRLLAKEFRDLPSNRMRLPIIFHNWLHRITEKAIVPDDDVMHHTVEAEKTGEDILHGIFTKPEWKLIERRRYLEKENRLVPDDPKVITIAAIEEIILNNLVQVKDELKQMGKIPEAFRTVEPDLPTLQLVRQIGRLATPDSLMFARMVNEPVEEALAA